MEKSYLTIQHAMLNTINTFSPFERVLFAVIFVVFSLSSLTLLAQVNAAFLKETPAEGGSITEGIIGTPRFINPLLAVSDADRDLGALIYSGLLRATPNGTFIPDLAESYTISDDGLIYSFVIRDEAIFHDGQPITAKDVLFTVKKAQDSSLKSPRRANWEGIMVEVVEEKEVRFILRQPYAPFLENASFGILPAHIWQNVDAESFPFSQFNIEPIGSGPYRIKKVKHDTGGVPTSYELVPFKSFVLGAPLIKTLNIKLYTSEEDLLDAFIKGDIDSMSGISPSRLNAVENLGARIEHVPLARIFAVFFNQDQNKIFAKKNIREALTLAIDKEKIVSDVLAGYGTTLNDPFPPGILPDIKPDIESSSATTTGNESTIYNSKTATEQALALLAKEGWHRREDDGMLANKDGDLLQFSLTTADTKELQKTAELLVSAWRDIGISVTLKLYEQSDLSQNSIRPRTYEALLFGEVVGRELDLFAFWHSSQRNDPGLNIALYTNIAVDKLLEEARATTDRTIRIEKLAEFAKEVRADNPAIFLYTPDFIYVLPPNIAGITLSGELFPHERFLTVYEWHIETEGVWSFLLPYIL
jgi:peptide/nickel transport system substrate-binding protein